MSVPNLNALNGNYSHKTGLTFKAIAIEEDNIILCLWSDKKYTEEQINNFLQAVKCGAVSKIEAKK
jgi:hypothetical protein